MINKLNAAPIKNNKYIDALLKLYELQDKFNGAMSKQIIDVLIQSTLNVKLTHIEDLEKQKEMKIF